MKYRLCMAILLLMLLSSCTAAQSEILSTENPESDSVEPITTDEKLMSSGDEILDNFDVMREIWNSLPEDPYHDYQYYSSMGCTKIACTDPEHTHWCPAFICRDPFHGHSEEEYAEAERYNPTCPCHAGRIYVQVEP